MRTILCILAIVTFQLLSIIANKGHLPLTVLAIVSLAGFFFQCLGIAYLFFGAF